MSVGQGPVFNVSHFLFIGFDTEVELFEFAFRIEDSGAELTSFRVIGVGKAVAQSFQLLGICLCSFLGLYEFEEQFLGVGRTELVGRSICA